MPAAFGHALQFRLQGLQAGNALLHLGETGPGDGIGHRAGLAGIVLQIEQGTDRLDLEAEFARMADESEPAHIGRLVETPIAVRARRRRQQADLLVVTDGRHLDAAALGGFADRHA